MNNETRLRDLLTYLDGLTTLTANDYRCNNEISECIGWIRDEFTKEPKERATLTINGVVISND